ncbi:hypothetical protein EYF80_050320 [Liparis tanakae]|uniref:Uncharacterized protein n=1 Tax=Liparis tanakae TaxID=230148 RepID=A0A4Z2FE33_9TELE|nr:hypothetical protein EYF80_050320 [Liparis tanakae]
MVDVEGLDTLEEVEVVFREGELLHLSASLHQIRYFLFQLSDGVFSLFLCASLLLFYRSSPQGPSADVSSGVKLSGEAPGATSKGVDKRCSFYVIEGDQTLLIVHKHPHLLSLSLQREKNWRVIKSVILRHITMMDLFPVIRQLELRMSRFRIKSHIHCKLLDPLQLGFNNQLLHNFTKSLLQLRHSSTHSPLM